MYSQESCKVYCPYCGELIEVLIDLSIEAQDYIEDCQVCCRPIEFRVSAGPDGLASVQVAHEND